MAIAGVEQARRRFAEFRQEHAVRSRLSEELWATAAKLARRDGITATARVRVFRSGRRSIGASRFHKAAEVSGPTSTGRECGTRLRGTADGQHGNGNQLCGGSGVVQRGKAAAGSKSDCHGPTGRVDSGFCSVVDMLAITPQMRILVAVEAVDFRKGIDSLAELCRQKLDADPFSGYLFVFRSRRATSIEGFWLATKRLSKGRFRWWPRMRNRRGVERIRHRCCWRQAIRTLTRRRCGEKRRELMHFSLTF